MEKLQWLEIKNFRGIKNARLEGFGDINIIVGRNNTGKSTILEAIYLNVANVNLDLLERDPFVVIFTRRGGSIFRIIHPLFREFSIDDIFQYLNYIFHSGNFDEPIELNSNLENYGFKLLKEEIPENLRDLVVSYFSKIPRAEVREILFILIDTSQRPLMIAIEEMRNETIRYDIIFTHKRTYVKDFKLRRQKKVKVILIDTHWLFSTDTIGMSQIQMAITRLEKKARIDKYNLADFISKQLELDVVSVESKIADIYLVTKDDRLIPFSLLGDGTKMAIGYYYTLSLSDSVILLEEPENHLHPKLMDTCIDLMLKSSKKNQIFITTHNIELLQKLLDKAQEYDVNLKVFSILSLKNGILDFESYSLEEAYAAVNKIGVDIR